MLKASLVVGDTASTLTTSEIVQAFPAATFTPVYLEYGAAPEPSFVSGNPLSIPANGFPLTSTYLLAGNYFMLTSLTDIWGNQGTELDAFTLIEPLGP